MRPNTIKVLEEKFIKKFNNKNFDFSISEYKNNYSRIKIICKKCGEILEVFPKEILKRGIICKNCLRINKQKEFIFNAKKIHNNFYNYDKVIFNTTKDKVKIICPKHGIFLQEPEIHILGHGCPQCHGGYKYTKDEFIKKANEMHNNFYNYKNVEYKSSIEKVAIICPKHGEFYQRPDYHLRGGICPICAGNSRINDKIFLYKLRKIYGDRYDFTLTKYNGINEKSKCICPEHGIFEKRAGSLLAGYGCKKCQKGGRSLLENEVYDFIRSIFKDVKIEQNVRSKLVKEDRTNSKLELDLYFPEISKAIEINGEYWHKKKEQCFPGIHKLKAKLCKFNNIKLLNIAYNEWYRNTELSKERLLKFLKK